MKKIDTFINKHIKWVFSLPALIFMLAMIAVPITMTLVFSLNEWNLLMGTGMKFNWGKNYMDVLSGSEFWQSLAITIYYTTLATVAEMLLGIAIAAVCVAGSLFVAGFALAGIGIGQLATGSLPIGFALTGAGLLLLAVAVLAAILCVWMCGKFVPWVLRLIGKLWNSIFSGKEKRV